MPTKGRALRALAGCLVVATFFASIGRAWADSVVDSDRCSERIMRHQMEFEKREHLLDTKAKAVETGLAARDGLEAQLGELIKQSPDQNSDATELERRRVALQTELKSIDVANKTAASELTTAWERLREEEAAEGWSCLPQLAFGLGVSAAAGASWITRYSIEGTLRLRLSSVAATEVGVGYVRSDDLVVDGRRSMVTFAGRVRHGRGNVGEFFYGPGIALANPDDGPVDLAAIFVQVGFSFSPQRSSQSHLSPDLRLFLEPWIPTDGRGVSVLFGVGVGLALM
jgi:hypothetical protein